MQIQSLTPTEFLTWRAKEPVYINAGLTVILGQNGAGKTGLGMDLPAWLLWGETFTGKKPEGTASGVFWGSDGITRYRVERTYRKGGKANMVTWKASSLSVAADAFQDLTGQTPTETEERIERVFGSFKRFTATRVFSRRLMARFGAATDKDRKALLEEVLGLDRFERAYQWMLKERRRLDGEHDKAKAALETAAAAVAQAQRAASALGAAEEPSVVEARLKVARLRRDEEGARVSELAKKATALGTAVQSLASRSSMLEGEMGVLTRKIRALVAAPTDVAPKVCPTCRRPLEGASQAAVQAHGAAEIAELEAAAAATRAQLSLVLEDKAPVMEAYAALSRKHRDADQAVRSLDMTIASDEAALRAAIEHADRVVRLRVQQDEATAAWRLKEDAARAAEAASESAAAACAILGPKGARAKLLAGSLAMLELGVNMVLPRMGGKVRSIKIRGSRTKADGDDVAEVAIEVFGAGGGRYEATSDGEQTRLDVALLVSLARLSSDNGYVGFDEVFDPLDDEGLEGAAELLAEMAKTRQVVVVTHNPRFTGLLPSARRLVAKIVTPEESALENG